MALRPTQNNVLLKGTSGCGKSYFLVDWIVSDILPFSDATIITNLPLGLVPETHFAPPKFEGETFLDRIYEQVPRGQGRIELLTLEDLEPWRNGSSGPWDLDVTGETYLIVDEFADYCHVHHKQAALMQWIEWFAKARHKNVWNIVSPQNDRKIPQKIKIEFGERWQLSDTAGHEMAFGILEGDFNQVISKVIGRDVSATQVIVRTDEGGTLSAKGRPHRISRHPSGYRLYDSFSAPVVGQDGHSRSKPWERLSWPLFMSWFIARNKWFVIKAFAFFSACWLLFSLDASAFQSREDKGRVEDVGFEKFAGESGQGGSDSREPVVADAPPAAVKVGRVGDRGFFVLGVSRGLHESDGESFRERVGSSFRAGSESGRSTRGAAAGSDRR